MVINTTSFYFDFFIAIRLIRAATPYINQNVHGSSGHPPENRKEKHRKSSVAEKEGGIVKKGHDEGMKLAVSLLEEFGLPQGLLPLANVIEVGFVRGTGYMWILQKKKVEHNFKIISKHVSYDTEINGYVEKNKIKKLKGVKAKELMLWPPVNEISVESPPTGKINFKSLAGITKTFPVEAFAAGQ